MTFELFIGVALREDFPSHKLHQGDVATIVDHHPVDEGKDGYSLKVFDAIGETITVLVVHESQVETLMRKEALYL